MAKKVYVGVNNTANQVKKMYIGVNGTARNIKKGYIGVGGVARQFFALGTPLRDIAEGSVIKLKENGSLVEFYVAKHNYESGLNGSGRTLVVRKDCYQNMAAGSATWQSSSLRSWLNNNYINMLDYDIRELIGTTQFYHTAKGRVTSVTTRSDAIFLLSATEYGRSSSYGYINVEGSTLPTASILRVAYLDGNAVAHWTRSPSNQSTSVVAHINRYGSLNEFSSIDSSCGVRPVFTLPDWILISDDMTVIT